LLFPGGVALAGEVSEYRLVVDEEEVEIAGELRRALTLNGGVPGPTLRFVVGDEAVIHVTNRLGTETSIHWHGILLPNSQDGVPHITTPPIEPGETRTFRFPIRHAGTYWYHSHTKLQEQRGIYGSIVIEPAGGEPHATDRDEVIVLSDWTDEDPDEVMRTLMRGSDWYSLRKGTLPTILGAARAGRLGDYFRAQWSRMPPMDVSDVAYDAFIANGRERLDLGGAPGETVRLRFINASASTYFFIHSSLGPLTIVGADGPAVEPVAADGFLIAIAETYDVIVTVPAEGSWEVRATAQDGSGRASVFLGSGEERPASEIPRPDLYTMEHFLEGAMESIGRRGGAPRPAEPAGGDGGHAGHGAHGVALPAIPPSRSGRPLSPYRALRAAEPSPPASDAPRRDLELRLTGEMTRFIWGFDGKSMAEEGVVRIHRGEVLRITLANDTMMHHPIHLHGHFFRVLDGDDDAAPLKHTVDVPPMGRRVIEFDANETGDWLFHCHVLYHMDAGMARVFSYGGPEHEPRMDPDMMGRGFPVGEASVLSNMTMGHIQWMQGREDIGIAWDVGYEHEDDDEDDPEYEADAFWEHFFDENIAARAGYRLTNEEDANDRAFAGVAYRLPLLVRARLDVDTRGDARFGLSKEFRLAERLELLLEGHYDTGTDFEGRAGLAYTLTRRFSLAVEAHSDHGFGAGVIVRF